VPGGGLWDGRCGLADHVPIAGWLAAGRSGLKSERRSGGLSGADRAQGTSHPFWPTMSG
jgi:hypothetical protein